MELLPLACFWLLAGSGRTSADTNEPLIKITVKEDDPVVLPCSLGSSSVSQKLFDWKKDGQKEVFMYVRGSHYNSGLSGQDKQFEGRVFHFPDKLQSGDASVRINKTKLPDSGTYTCDFPNEEPIRRSTVELVVGTCPTPVIKTFKTNDEVLLECKVVGASPKPEVELRDSTGTKIPANEENVSQNGNHYTIVQTAVVIKEDYYHCVVKQREICHETKSTDTLVQLPGSDSGLSVGLVVILLAVGIIIGVVVGGVGVYCCCQSKSRGSQTQRGSVVL